MIQIWSKGPLHGEVCDRTWTCLRKQGYPLNAGAGTLHLPDLCTMRSVILSTLLAFALLADAQDYVTPDQYAFRVDTDLIYGVDTNYMGLLDTLRLDIYKPNGNADTQRPLVVFVHGGNWLGGCKDDPNGIVPMLQQMVKRGYVVSSVNYRLGWHKDDYVSDPVAGCPLSFWPLTYRAFYAADSAEMKRAIYRGMQDVKGAIRWMKARAAQDSVCVDKVFVGGESAGGFIALATAFLDREAEKPAACGALPDAPVPYYKTLNLTTLNCVADTFTVSGGMLARPDLGPVEGDLNQNGFDAGVRGVANFFGGVPYEALAQDWLQGVDTPAVYMYHQTCDGVVIFGRGQPLSTMSAYCNLGSTPWHSNYPTMYGSGAIKAAFDAMASPPLHLTDFEPCVPLDPNIALFDCSRYADNGSYHYTANPALRGQNLSAFWAPLAGAPGSCISTSISTAHKTVDPVLFPQPASEMLQVSGLPLRTWMIMDAQGRTVSTGSSATNAIDVRYLKAGIYLLQARTAEGPLRKRFVVAR